MGLEEIFYQVSHGTMGQGQFLTAMSEYELRIRQDQTRILKATIAVERAQEELRNVVQEIRQQGIWS